MRKKKNGKNPRCFECQRELSSTRREKYKDKIRERSRAYNKKKYEKIKQVQEEHQELTARDQEIKNNEEKMYRLEQRVRELEFENEYLKSMLEKENISGLVSL